jgi:hypothetical protein
VYILKFLISRLWKAFGVSSLFWTLSAFPTSPHKTAVSTRKGLCAVVFAVRARVDDVFDCCGEQTETTRENEMMFGSDRPRGCVVVLLLAFYMILLIKSCLESRSTQSPFPLDQLHNSISCTHPQTQQTLSRTSSSSHSRITTPPL